MSILKNYSVHHYYGDDNEKPNKLPPGDFYFAEDTGILYKYNKFGIPVKLNNGFSDLEILFDINRNENGDVSKIISRYNVEFPHDKVEVKDILQQTYDINSLDNDVLLEIKYNGDWTMILPDISSIEENFETTISHKVNGNSTGTVVPHGGDIIDGASNAKMYGTGLMSLKKISSGGGFEWLLLKSISYNTVHMQGKTRMTSFFNQSTIQINHNLGFIPIVQVWVEDGEGGFVEANVDIDHDWDDMNSFEIQLNSTQSGKIIY
tara:strand:- start:3074 stop:3862 length:789 start_codon:yes stop_codon:yes gene_type:complete